MPDHVDALELEDTKNWLRQSGYLNSINKSKFNRTLKGVHEKLASLDETFEPHLETRALQELGVAERTILRIAAFELSFTQVPTAVAINEWVDIAKDYGAESSYKFINGVLDKLARDLASKESVSE